MRYSVVGNRQLNRLNESGGVAVHLGRISGDQFHVAFQGTQSTSLSIWTTSTKSGFISKPKVLNDLISIRFIDQGTMLRSNQNGKEVVAGSNHALYSVFAEMEIEQASPGFSATSATVRRSDMGKAWQALFKQDASTLPNFQAYIKVEDAGILALRQTIWTLGMKVARQLDPGDLIIPLLHEVLIYQIIGSWPKAGFTIVPEHEDASDRQIKSAVEFIEDRISLAISLDDIASYVGVSVRTLQSSFKKKIGLSPIQFLIMRRLDRAMEDLSKNNTDSVGEVARRWGFVHMSDFSRRYKQRFGKTPKQR
jgi:AraC-like DNA-binding protein